ELGGRQGEVAPHLLIQMIKCGHSLVDGLSIAGLVAEGEVARLQCLPSSPDCTHSFNFLPALFSAPVGALLAIDLAHPRIARNHLDQREFLSERQHMGAEGGLPGWVGGLDGVVEVGKSAAYWTCRSWLAA